MFEKLLKENSELMMVRRKLHKFVSPKVLAVMNEARLSEIAPYLYPMKIEKLKRMMNDDPRIWYYLTTPDCDLVRLESLRGKAMGILEECLEEGDEERYSTRESVMLFKEKIALAKSILEMTKIKSENSGTLTQREILSALPKDIRTIDAEELEDQLSLYENEF